MNFDLVLDIGGNVGEWAEQAIKRWPAAQLVSFEPVPELADANVRRAAGRWTVERIAVSDSIGRRPLYVCENQHTASTMMEAGGARRREFGIVDNFTPIMVETMPLDAYLWLLEGRDRVLVKVDVEGHEGAVLRSGQNVLSLATVVVVECNQDADIFIDAPEPADVDGLLRGCGLGFAGVADVLLSPAGRVLQFDGVWSRDGASL